jgi:hypothetical protein
MSDKTEHGKKLGTQGLITSVAAQPKAAQLCPDQYSQSRKYEIKGISNNTKGKTARKLGQHLSNQRADNFPPGVGTTAKPAGDKLLPAVGQSQSGLETALPEPSQRPRSAALQSNKDEILLGMQKPNETLLTKSGPTHQKAAKELIHEAVVDAGGKTTAAGEKPAIALTSQALVDEKASSLTSKKLTPEALGDADTKTSSSEEKAAMAGKPVVSASQKTPELNIASLTTRAKSSNDTHQNTPAGPEKSTLTGRKQTAGETVTAQVLSESPAGTRNKARTAGNNLSNGPPLQKLNITEFQLSTGQTKDPGNPTSDNSPRPDLAQPLPHSSEQPSISETLFDAAWPAAKTSNHSSPAGSF